jgi:hypothetical protein
VAELVTQNKRRKEAEVKLRAKAEKLVLSQWEQQQN